MSFKKPLFFWVRLILGIIFILASVDKIIHPAAFARIIYNYQILPDGFINLAAILLPWMETLLGILLILGVWLPGTVVFSNIFLVVFFGALVSTVARGLNIHCGCFSTSTEGDPNTVWYFIRDSAFLIMGGYLLFKVISGDGTGEKSICRS